MIRLRTVILLAAGLATVAVGCGSDEPSAATGELTPSDIVHVHDLVPASGTDDLLVATHVGLFRLGPDGVSEQLDVDRSFDVMGFAVSGDTWLVSGHPQLVDDEFLVEDRPPLLGIVASTDGGTTWESRSSLGQIDLHAIAARGDELWGVDSFSGQLLYSADGGRSLEPLTDLAQAADLTVDESGQRLLATTPDGLIASDDAGRSWSAPLDPTLLEVEWISGDVVIGSDTEGGLWRSTDGAQSWESDGDAPDIAVALTGTTEGDIWVADRTNRIWLRPTGGDWVELTTTD